MPTKTNPAKRGRKPDANSKSGQIRTLLAEGMATADIAKKVGCTPALIYQVKAKASGGSKPTRAKRNPGRPAKSTRASMAASNLDSIGAILAAVKDSENERRQLRAALEKIQSVITTALA
ncbi:MAG: helix-turn-helix domain-containing protein [Planctomycetota bacterium]